MVYMIELFFQAKAELIKEFEAKLQNVEFGVGPSTKAEFEQ